MERFFCKFEQFRPIVARFGKLARNFLAAVVLAFARPWARFYDSTA